MKRFTILVSALILSLDPKAVFSISPWRQLKHHFLGDLVREPWSAIHVRISDFPNRRFD
jgi:hypothetical protein